MKWKGGFNLCICLVCCLGFFAVSLYAKINALVRHDQWGQVVALLSCVVLFSFFVSWKCRRIDIRTDSILLKKFFVGYVFVFFLYYPLASQFSAFGKSVDNVRSSVFGNNITLDNFFVGLAKIPGSYESSFQKNIRIPHWLVQFNALVKVYVFNVSPNNNIALGEAGFYFEGMGGSRVEKEIVENYDNIADYMGQNPFTEAQLLQWKIALEQRRYWLKEEFGTEYLFALAPTKAFVYPEYLPEKLREVKGTTRYQQLSRYLQKYADIHFVDLLPPLLEAKKQADYPLLFYKTDFHWNYYGAFVAYKAMVSSLHHALPEWDFHSPQLDDFEMQIKTNWAHRRFMYMLGLPITFHENEHHITMVPKKGSPYDTAKDIPPGGIYDHYPATRKITASDGAKLDVRLLLNPGAPVPSLVLFGDSFLEKCMYFFCANAQRVLNFRTVINFPAEVFKYEKPTVVVQEILNMFILRPPPRNPPVVERNYFAYKFKKNGDKVVFTTTVSPNAEARERTTVSGHPESVPLGPLGGARQGEIRVAAVKLQANRQGTLTFSMSVANETVVAKRTCKVNKGENICYFDVPSGPVATLRVLPEGAGSVSTTLSVEIRSDAVTP
jgi:hypothetical protein